MPKEQLEQILDYTRKGATMEMIARHYGISLRTLSRRLKDYKEDVKQAREYYKTVVSNIFK